MWLRKYFQVFKTSWENGFVYRLNFVMWRFRSVLRLFLLYFIWSAIFSHSDSVFGYQKSVMLTYVIGNSFLRSFVLGSRSIDVGAEISAGDLSNYLLKPLNYLRYWLARDLADKVLNILFVVVELSLIIFLLKPALALPTQASLIIGFSITAGLAMILFFYLSLLISMITFWYPEHAGWPARFLFEVTIFFIAGSLFPLDILPASVFSFIKLLPTTYLIFFPLQVGLGRIQGTSLMMGLLVMIFWIIALRMISKFVWRKGIRVYEAYGR